MQPAVATATNTAARLRTTVIGRSPSPRGRDPGLGPHGCLACTCGVASVPCLTRTAAGDGARSRTPFGWTGAGGDVTRARTGVRPAVTGACDGAADCVRCCAAEAQDPAAHSTGMGAGETSGGRAGRDGLRLRRRPDGTAAVVARRARQAAGVRNLATPIAAACAGGRAGTASPRSASVGAHTRADSVLTRRPVRTGMRDPAAAAVTVVREQVGASAVAVRPPGRTGVGAGASTAGRQRAGYSGRASVRARPAVPRIVRGIHAGPGAKGRSRRRAACRAAVPATGARAKRCRGWAHRAATSALGGLGNVRFTAVVGVTSAVCPTWST